MSRHPTGSKRERQPGVWELRVNALDRRGRRKPVSRTVHGTEQDADARLQRLLIEVEDGKHQGDPRRTVDGLLDRYLKHVGEQGRRQRTLDSYNALVRLHIKPALGHKKVAKLTSEDIDDFYSDMRQGPAARSVHHAHAVLRGALRQAEAWGWIGRGTNPALLASPGGAPEADIDPPPVDEVVKLLNEAQRANAEFGMFLFLKAITGARRGEMCGLRRNDVDLERLVDPSGFVYGEVRFECVVEESSAGTRLRRRGKTKGSTRPVALGPETVAVLVQYLDALAERAQVFGTELIDNHFLFSREPDCSEFLKPTTATDWFGTVRGRLGFSWRMHDLRHFETTQLLHAGYDVRMVAGRGGWASAKMVLDRYGHFMPSSDQAAAGFMERLLLPGPDAKKPPPTT